MNRMWTFATGFGVGLGLMYLMDPERGTRRRSLVRDKGVRLTHDLQEFLGKAGRDLRNRARGVLAERTRFAQSQPTDDVLAEPVQRNWTPALRLATVMAALAMLAVAVRRARSHEGRIEDLSPDLSFHG